MARPRLDAGAAEFNLDAYLDERLWNRDIVSELDLDVLIDREGHVRVRHPFRHRGKRIGWQARAVEDGVEPRWRSSVGPLVCPYEADRLAIAHETGWVILTEGVSDATTVISTFEGAAVVGVPGTSAFKADWVGAFDGLSLFVVGDNDSSGAKFRATVESLLSPVASVTHVMVPEAFSDVTDWLVRLGDPDVFAEGFNEACKRAVGSSRG